MARPNKKGLDYFPLDAGWDRDIKTVFIINTYKTAALAVIPAILKQIYTDAGYYAEATEIFYKSMAAVCFVEPETVREIVEAGLESGLFNREKFEEFGILTSHGIQSRYLRARRDSAKKQTPIEEIFCPAFLLLEDEDPAEEEAGISGKAGKSRGKSEFFGESRGNSPKIPDNRGKSGKVGDKRGNSPQKKRKENKVNNTINPPLPPPQGEESAEESPFEASEAEKVVEVWNEVFPPPSPRHVSGGILGANSLYFANIRETLEEYPADNLAVYRRAFTTLAGSRFSWGIHAAVKLANFRTLLTEAEIAERPRSGPGKDTSHRAPVNTREDFLANPWPNMARNN